MIEELNGDFLQWLRGFYYIAQTGSIRKAAQMMNRNPSTISYQLRSLETELNTVLFDRYKKSLQITAEGERLLQWAISTFETLRGMRLDVAAPPGSLQGTVIISGNLPFAVQVVGIISRFCEQYPKVRIKIRRALDQGVIEDVESSKVDFGLAASISPPASCHFEELFESRPLLITPKDNNYKLPPNPMPDDLKNLQLVTFMSEKLEATWTPLMGDAARYLDIGTSVLSVNNYHLMLQYVRQGVGAAIMDEMCFKSSLFGDDWSGLISYPLDGFLDKVKYGIFVRKQKHLSPQAKAIMENIRSEMRNMDMGLD